jgi:hypothetical protein
MHSYHHNTSHQRFTIQYMACSQYIISTVHNTIHGLLTIHHINCSQYNTWPAHNTSHQRFTIQYMACSKYITSTVHNTIHGLLTIHHINCSQYNTWPAHNTSFSHNLDWSYVFRSIVALAYRRVDCDNGNTMFTQSNNFYVCFCMQVTCFGTTITSSELNYQYPNESEKHTQKQRCF